MTIDCKGYGVILDKYAKNVPFVTCVISQFDAVFLLPYYRKMGNV